jgi:hypothetical protein
VSGLEIIPLRGFIAIVNPNVVEMKSGIPMLFQKYFPVSNLVPE